MRPGTRLSAVFVQRRGRFAAVNATLLCFVADYEQPHDVLQFYPG